MPLHKPLPEAHKCEEHESEFYDTVPSPDGLMSIDENGDRVYYRKGATIDSSKYGQIFEPKDSDEIVSAIVDNLESQ